MGHMTAKVAVAKAIYAIDRPYDYRVPQELEGRLRPGMRVLVPFGAGNRGSDGIVLALSREGPEGGLKDVIAALDDQPVLDEKLLKLAANNISVISMHTNLDIAKGGVNDVLMEALGAAVEAPLDEQDCGRVGALPKPISMPEFLSLCKDVLKTKGLRYYDSGRPVEKLAVMGGSGGDSVETAFHLGCDTYLTADIKYHQFLQAAELGINLIDGDHFCTENLVMPVLAERLAGCFKELSFIVSARHCQLIDFA